MTSEQQTWHEKARNKLSTIAVCNRLGRLASNIRRAEHGRLHSPIQYIALDLIFCWREEWTLRVVNSRRPVFAPAAGSVGTPVCGMPTR